MPDNVSDNPTLEALIIAAAKGEIANVHTCLPGTVVSYNSATQTAVVQPAVVGRRRDQATGLPVPVPFAPVGNVPVIWPAGLAGTNSVTMPLAPGTFGLLFFAERSVDEYLATGNPAAVPADLRRFDITDAFFLPGGRPDTAPLPATAVDPVATVMSGPLVKLGSSVAIHPLLHADTFEADLLSFLTALDTWASAVAAAVPAVAGATTVFLTASGVFQATLVTAHKSLTVSTD